MNGSDRDVARPQPRVKSAGALTESRREFESLDREGDANARCSRRSPIGPTQTESAAAKPVPRMAPESPTFPPPRPDAGNQPGHKAKPARFRGPVRSALQSRVKELDGAVRLLGEAHEAGLPKGEMTIERARRFARACDAVCANPIARAAIEAARKEPANG